MYRLEIEKNELEKILLNSDVTENGWFFKNTDLDTVREIYNFYRTAVLDGLIPFSAVTGISVNNISVKSVFDMTNYRGIKESLISISQNFGQLLFPPAENDIKLKSQKISGKITGRNLIFSDGSNEYKPLTDSYICTASVPVKFNLRLSTGTGIRRTHEFSSDKKANKKYVPVRPNFSLYRFIVVTGYSETAVYHRIINDIDLNALKSVIINFLLDKEVQPQPEVVNACVKVSDIFDSLYSRASVYGKAIKAVSEIYYSELKNDKEYTDINDQFFFENQKAEKLGRRLSDESEISIKKTSKEYEMFKDLFVRDSIDETAGYLSGIKRVSSKSAEILAGIIHEYV